MQKIQILVKSKKKNHLKITSRKSQEVKATITILIPIGQTE